jgi:subtilisin family serine protease
MSEAASLGPGAARRRGWFAAVLVAVAAAVAAAAVAVAVVLPVTAHAQASAPAPTPTAGAATTDPEAAMRADSARYIVLAVDNPVQRVPGRAGSSLPAYAPPLRYVVGAQAAGVLSALQREHGLQPAAAWPIPALGLHCVVYGLPPQASREALLRTLAADPRVRLVQPLQDFELHASPPQPMAAAAAAAPAAPAPPEEAAPAYNDPYLPLQRGFAETGAARAHRSSTGRDVAVAVIDTGAELAHPDLQGRVAGYRDLVSPASQRDAAAPGAALGADRHGTEVAGVIAAVANNGQGIVGIAPGARLALYKACWYPVPLPNAQGSAAATAARCNSFTLAKALAAVLESDARIVNLSLGGPTDPLLEALMAQLLRQRRIVVTALPPSGRVEGFPAGVAGVIVVGTAGAEALPAGVLAAPGRDVLTLAPGGRYDFASGSSVAAAHASGIVALLLALQPGLDAPALRLLLAGDAVPGQAAASIKADAALLRLARARY